MVAGAVMALSEASPALYAHRVNPLANCNTLRSRMAKRGAVSVGMIYSFSSMVDRSSSQSRFSAALSS
jgi:hypothetical protein